MKNRDYDVIFDQKINLFVPDHLRKGRLRGAQKKSIISGAQTMDYIISDILERKTYSGIDILDYGCGVKFTQAILQYDLDVNSYYGIDIHRPMINFLQRNVKDPRFEYARVNFYNELYTKGDGAGMDKMSEDFVLPCEGKLFDVITMQSVMTHFNPTDYKNCLLMLKKYLRPGGHIFFTCILNQGQEEPFTNLNPERPLLRASYQEEYALQLVEEAGMKIDKYYRRKHHAFLPEHILCSPKKN